MLIHSTQTSQNVVHKNYNIASINSRADGCSAVSTFPRSISALPSLADVDRGTKRSVPSECHSRPSQTTDWRHSARTPLVAVCLDVHCLVVFLCIGLRAEVSGASPERREVTDVEVRIWCWGYCENLRHGWLFTLLCYHNKTTKEEILLQSRCARSTQLARAV